MNVLRVVRCPKCGTTHMDRVALSVPDDEGSQLLFRCALGHVFEVAPRHPPRPWFKLGAGPAGPAAPVGA